MCGSKNDHAIVSPKGDTKTTEKGGVKRTIEVIGKRIICSVQRGPGSYRPYSYLDEDSSEE